MVRYHARAAAVALGELAYHVLALLVLGLVALALCIRAGARRLGKARPPSKSRALAHPKDAPHRVMRVVLEFHERE